MKRKQRQKTEYRIINIEFRTPKAEAEERKRREHRVKSKLLKLNRRPARLWWGHGAAKRKLIKHWLNVSRN